jgi:DNA-binding beta-propeller fold protein YncE
MLRYIRLVGTICLFFGLSGCGSGGSAGSDSSPSASRSLMGGSIQGKPAAPTGVVTTLAGTAANMPFGITTDGTNLYVADYGNSIIKKIVIATGSVTTLACPVLSFAAPTGITTDGTNLYVVDAGTNSILKIVIATGAVTPLAGYAASFYHPYGITTDGTNLYVTDTGNNTIRKIVIATGAVTTLAGSPPPTSPGSTDTDTKTGATALFHSPYGITTDGTNLYVTDTGNNTIRKIQ